MPRQHERARSNRSSCQAKRNDREKQGKSRGTCRRSAPGVWRFQSKLLGAYQGIDQIDRHQHHQDAPGQILDIHRNRLLRSGNSPRRSPSTIKRNRSPRSSKRHRSSDRTPQVRILPIGFGVLAEACHRFHARCGPKAGHTAPCQVLSCWRVKRLEVSVARKGPFARMRWA